MARVRDGGLWHHGAAGQPDLLGCCASHASPIHRQTRRSALSPRRQMVVAYGLDPAWLSSQRNRHAFPLRTRPATRPLLPVAGGVALAAITLTGIALLGGGSAL